MQYGLGAIPSPHDRRDYSVASFSPIVTLGDYMPPDILKTKNQGAVGACVAYGLEHQAAVHYLMEHGHERRFDPNYVYGYRGAEDYQGEGMIVREALQMQRRNGISDEGQLLWPYAVFYAGLKNQQQYYTPEVHANAMYQRIESYYSAQTEAEIDTALLKGPVGFVIPIYSSFINPPANGILPMPNPSLESMHGAHYVVAVGKRGRYWVIQHWWGDWGDQSMLGYCMGYLPIGYPMYEAWGTIDEPLPPKQQTNITLILNNPLATVNGKQVYIDPANHSITPTVADGRTRVPLRFVAESFGAEVGYDDRTKTVTIKGR